jgi:uncharacterized protein (DUF2147 family)
MKHILLAAALVALAAPAVADPVFGRWRTAPDDNGNSGVIEIAACGNRICGTLIQAINAQGQPMNSPNVGRLIVWDMEARGNGQYRNGQVWSPDRNQTYSARMELRGDQLGVSGCVLAVICRESVWSRVR